MVVSGNRAGSKPANSPGAAVARRPAISAATASGVRGRPLIHSRGHARTRIFAFELRASRGVEEAAQADVRERARDVGEDLDARGAVLGADRSHSFGVSVHSDILEPERLRCQGRRSQPVRNLDDRSDATGSAAGAVRRRAWGPSSLFRAPGGGQADGRGRASGRGTRIGMCTPGRSEMTLPGRFVEQPCRDAV